MNNGTKLFLSTLGYGKEKAKNAHALYLEHKLAGGVEKLSIFQRLLRIYASDARKCKIKVVGDNDGYYIAKDDAEWEEYTRTQLNSVYSKIVSIAMCEGKTVSQIIRKKLSGKKVTDTEQQLSFF